MFERIKLNALRWIEDFNSGFKTYLITILVFFIFSVFWILASDQVLLVLFPNVNIYAKIQSYKGLLYVALTTLLLFVLLYRNFRRMKELMYQNLQSEMAMGEIKEEYAYVDDLNHLMLDFLSQLNVTMETMVVDFYRLIKSKVKESDCGSVFKIEDGLVHFLDCHGYDLNVLNQTPFKANEFSMMTYNILRDLSPEKNIKRRLGDYAYRKYAQSNPVIVESVHLGLYKNKGVQWGMSIDISQKVQFKTQNTFREDTLIALKEFQTLVAAFIQLREMAQDQKNLQKDIVGAFVIALEYHDFYTKGHSEAVSHVSVQIGRAMGLDSHAIDDLKWAGIVHDIGKIAISTEILNKKERLTDAEFSVIKQHPELGATFIEVSDSLKNVALLVRHHHERFDGKGYPDGLAGEQIPLLSRIISVADAWHAMTSQRPYREKLSNQMAIEEIASSSGSQFCPKVVEAALPVLLNLYGDQKL